MQKYLLSVFIIVMEKIGLDHFNYLSDNFGIWQHTQGAKIDRQHGYALDDAARALILAKELGLKEKAKVYLNFIRESVSPHRIINFFDKKRQPLPLDWSEDALGESYWAIAQLYDEPELKNLCSALALQIEQRILKFSSVRGTSYSLLGAIIQNHTLAEKLSDFLIKTYELNKRWNWHWLENELTYGNAIVPLALIEFGHAAKDSNALNVGFEMLDFLNKTTKVDRKPIAIGNNGWFKKGREKSTFDQQPVDISYQIIANVSAYEISLQDAYLAEAKTYFSWFWGNNCASRLMVDPKRHLCFDGINEKKISDNSGAESIVCFLLAQEKIWPYLEK